jgi:hypothetical protein
VVEVTDNGNLGKNKTSTQSNVVYVPNGSVTNEKYVYLVIIGMIISSGLSIIMVKVFKCFKNKENNFPLTLINNEKTDIIPIADLEMHKNKEDFNEVADSSGFVTATTKSDQPFMTHEDMIDAILKQNELLKLRLGSAEKAKIGPIVRNA